MSFKLLQLISWALKLLLMSFILSLLGGQILMKMG